MNTKDRVLDYRRNHPEATMRDIQVALGLSTPSLVHWHLKGQPSKRHLAEMATRDCERRACAKVASDLAKNPQQIRLHCGEMTAQEMRTAKAVLGLVAYLIETRCERK